MEVLRYGTEGYLVKLLQYALTRAGEDAGHLDGIFGRRTLRALQSFQRTQGLADDGMAGPLTWAALYPYMTGYALHRVGPEETATVPLDLPVVTDSLPCSYLLTGLMLKGLTMRYPFLSAYEIGRSVMGRPIMAVSVGEGSKLAGYVGPHGADAGSTVLGMLRFLEKYAAAYATGGSVDGVSAGALYEAVTLHLVPLINPDGVDLAAGALDPMDSFYIQAQALAAHYPHIPFPDGWRGNISGVDLRHQYPMGWEASRRDRFARGFTRPGPRDYVGSEPRIAPEVRAVARWAEDHDFSLLLSHDAGFTAWATAAAGRRGVTLHGAAGEISSLLAQNLPLSP